MARPWAALTRPCSLTGASASSWVDSVGETMPIPSAATAHATMPGTSPMTSSESSTGPSEPSPMSPAPRPARAGADTTACTRLMLLSHEPSAHRHPVTDSEMPATAVDAPCVCTSMSGMRPATAVNAADVSSRTAMTVGTPRASRTMPWGSARSPPTTTSTATGGDDDGPGERGCPGRTAAAPRTW